MDDNVNKTVWSMASNGQYSHLLGSGNPVLLMNPMVAIIIGFIILVAITRSISARNSVSTLKNGGQTVPGVPYWVPILGHIPNMAFDADGFVKKLRGTYENGIFALNFGGTTHNIVYTPGLTTALLNQKPSNADFEHVSKMLMKTIFGFPGRELKVYDTALQDIMACYKLLLSEPYLGDMVTQTVSKLRENATNLVSGMTSAVDQMPWERNASVRVLEPTDGAGGPPAVEASLLPLIRDFCAFTAIPTLLGSDFLANFPEAVDDLWTLDRGFLLLAAGLPRWFPVPAVTSAHLARRRNLRRISVFHEALEAVYDGRNPAAKWTSLDDVGSLVSARMQVYRKHNLSIAARAALEHALLWAANANSNPLIFWMLTRIYADRALLAMLREEIAPYVTVDGARDHGLPIAEPPRLGNVNIEGLCARCPLLKSCYIECLRLDAATWSLKVVKRDFVLQSRDKDTEAWVLRKGEYAHAAHDLHHTDPNFFENPMVFKADRHVKYDEKEGSADMGSIRPYGGGTSMCKGRSFAFKECMVFTATIIAMWELEPADGKPWKMPRHVKATGVYNTSDVTRVRIKQRKFS